MLVTPEPARLDPDTRTPRQSLDDQKGQKGDPAHDDTDVRMVLEGDKEEEEEGPREGWGVRRNGDAFDSLGLWDDRAVVGHDHHISDLGTGARANAWADSHAVADDSSGLDLASASPEAVHARHRWPVADRPVADTAVDRRRAGASAQRFSSGDMLYERARKLKRVQKRG
ncbi:MAG: hypothetical protein Q9184_004665 [Pyrenodesmia sp. 2 TL-2023]